MRKILILLFTFLSFSLSAQIIRTVGIVYTGTSPTHTPSSQGAWVAIDTLTGQWYERDQTAGIWREMGARLQATNTYGVPSYTPSKQRGRLAINSGDSLYYYQAGTWTHINDVGSVDLTPYVEYADSLTTFVTPTMLDDTSAAIRGDFPVNTDSTTVLFQDSILIYYTINGVEYDRDTIRTSGSGGGGGGGGSHVQYSDSLTVFVTPSQLVDSLATIPDSIVTGYGVTGYLPQYNSTSTLDTTGMYWDGSKLGIGIIPSAFPLEVQGRITSYGKGTISGIQIERNVGGAFHVIRDDGSNNVGIYAGGAGRVFLAPAAVQALTAFYSGSAAFVGIGQTTPTARLHITGSGSTSATTALLVENSTGTDALKINDAQQVTIGTGAHTASSILDVQSTTAGFLPPRMTTVQRDAISSPANGLIIFCSDCTATDGSTGVSQTFSSSSWRNHY